jgi:PadR family transcriptional regulator, regulatory protein AphA
MSGYDLKSLMENSTGHFWHAYHSQIYTTLRKLEEDGALTSEEIEDDQKLNRRVYTITNAGKAELYMWLKQSLTEMPQVKEELLVRIFFSGSRNTEDTLRELRHHHELHTRQLALYESLSPHHWQPLVGNNPDLAREAVYWASTLNFGIRYERLYLAWLEETMQQLQNL